MNDITALAQRMKAAAENLDGDTWHDEGASVYGGAYDVGDTVCYDHIVDCENVNGESLVAEFIAIANPANVLALVEALEKAQQKIVEIQQGCENDPRIHEIIDLKEHVIETNDVLCNLLPDCRYMDPPDGGSVTPLEQVSRMVADYRQRIAELESEVKFPGVMHCNSCGFSRSHVIVTPGGMRAGESTPEHCPNGCGPMWHDTYRRQYNELYDAYKALESRTVTVKLPPRVDSSNVPFTAHTWNCCLDAVEKCLTAAGIQVIEGDQKNG